MLNGAVNGEMRKILLISPLFFILTCASAQKPTAVKVADLSVEVSEVQKAKTFFSP
jgi:hypothetical protein